jgi:hypothetical protein
MPGADPAVRIASDGRPAFVMTGIDLPDGRHRLYASRDLPTDVGFGQRNVREHDVAWHVDADMEHVLIIDDATWEGAFARMFEIWRNQDRARLEEDQAMARIAEHERRKAIGS